ncbi:hypothetical protein J7U46_05145 [Pelomonas sp. V22]|uniref:hypothetical protein n=1 Tax=Pelomonas sp. V22 TaxID=2822139 RepID=UPI0024A7DA00|nr:hypothetical protein [Pelomonas sp. V22]MDI4632422.1 hypothetical protein [Pelomonas sp. V22]
MDESKTDEYELPDGARIYLAHLSEFIALLPFAAILSIAIGVLLLVKSLSLGVQNSWLYFVGGGLLGLGVIAFIYVGLAHVVHIRYREREHVHLVRYVEKLRRYTVNGFQRTQCDLPSLNDASTLAPPAEVPKVGREDLGRPLGTKERNTLLTIISVLCHEAKIDHSRPAAAAATIKHMADLLGLRLGESTIEDHLKRIPAAVEARSK